MESLLMNTGAIKRWWLSLFTVLYLLTPVEGKQVTFNSIGLSNGMSSTSVMELDIDSLGRIWLGTRDGVNLYDGNTIKVYRVNGGEGYSLLSRHVHELKVHKNKVYVATPKGLSVIDIKTDKIFNYPDRETYAVEIVKNTICLGNSNGVKFLNINDYSEVHSEIDSLGAVERLVGNKGGGLWVCTSKGLYKINRSFSVVKRVLNRRAMDVKVDSRKNIWVGTRSHGLYLMDRRFNIIKHFEHIESDANSLADNFVRAIEEDLDGNMWVGTFGGLSIIDWQSYFTSNYYHEDNNSETLSYSSIYDIKRDANGIMWLGTYYGGLNYYDGSTNVYRHIKKGKEGDGLSYSVVGRFAEDEDNNIWLTTQGGGLSYLDRKTKEVKHFKIDRLGNDMTDANFNEFLLDKKGNLVISRHLVGLLVYDPEKNEVQYCKNNEILINGLIDDILPWKDDFLLATRDGIKKFNTKTLTLSPFNLGGHNLFEDIWVRMLFEDSNGILWIATNNKGMYTYDSKINLLKSFVPVNLDSTVFIKVNVTCMYEDTDFRLWMGSGDDGVFVYDRSNDEAVNFNSMNSGLAGDVINGIAESRYGNFWVASNNGLTRIDIDNRKFYSYTAKEGFPLEELTIRSLLMTADGELFAGGTNGMVSFKEEDILKQESNYQMVLSDLYVNNNLVKPGDKTGILSNVIEYSNSISLGPNDNVFRVHYSSCNYNRYFKSHYEYMLEGFDEDWVDNGQRDFISYTNLDPKTYKLKIRVFNSSNEKIIDEKSLIITVEPPIYRTWYAYLIYLVGVGGLLWGFLSMYIIRVRLKDKLFYEIKDKENIKQLNQAKLRFFTNISHEFRTPLTLISGTLENVLNDTKLPVAMNHKLISVRNNADRLKKLITELLDFRKMEQQGLKLKVIESELNHFIGSIVANFQSFADAKEIDLVFHQDEKICSIWFDPYQMEKVFFNLLSNAMKFISSDSGKIAISIKEHEDCWDVIVTDNGRGMNKEEVSNVFERFYHLDKIGGKASIEGTGIGLALCKGIVDEHRGQILINSIEGEGTSFTVRLKKGKEHYEEQQFVQETIWMAQEIPVPETELSEEMVTSNNGSSVKLLIVEDNSEVRGLLKMIFSDYYQVIEAGDGKEGIDQAIKESPDLIISDVMMPVMDGIQMCSNLKRNEETSHIPIILLTAKTSEDAKIKGLETGADAYVEKPFNTQMLMLRVRNILNNKWKLQKRFKQDPQVEVKEIGLNSLDQKLLEKAIQVVETHIENVKFGVEEFAKEMGLGRTRLFTKIKGVTGQTPNEFILSVRMKKASILLGNNPEMNVSDIAYTTGFTTPGYFSKCFKSYYGMSPLQYRSSKNE